jgi:hypothetical protein
MHLLPPLVASYLPDIHTGTTALLLHTVLLLAVLLLRTSYARRALTYFAYVAPHTSRHV